MKDNIIDFNSRKESKKQPKPLPLNGHQRILEALDNYLATLPQNGLMAEAAALVTELTGRAMLYSTIAAKASEVIEGAGLDPDDFELDDDSFGRFLQIEIEDDDLEDEELNDYEHLWNGPLFDWEDGETVYRVATTIIISARGSGTLGMDLLRIGEDDSRWQMYNEGKWFEGPPEDVFDFLVAQREGGILDDDEWDDDEWENSIDSMFLSRSVITALHNAGIHTIEELKEMSDAELLRLKGIGKARVAEIREALEYED